MSVSLLPSVNAALNAMSFLLLLTGYFCIRRGRTGAHKGLMIGACFSSALFLVSYLSYHAQVGSVRYTGEGWRRFAYLAILISHSSLALVIVPLVLRTLFLALRGRFAPHRAIARWTLPLWLYVSVTGVVVYAMLYHLS